MASDQITADMVELGEFTHLAHKYDVKGVPKTVINEEFDFMGALSEADLAKKVLEAVGKGEVESKAT